MNNSEKAIANDVLKNGNVISVYEYIYNNRVHRQYTVVYAGEQYLITYEENQAIYFHHDLKPVIK